MLSGPLEFDLDASLEGGLPQLRSYDYSWTKVSTQEKSEESCTGRLKKVDFILRKISLYM